MIGCPSVRPHSSETHWFVSLCSSALVVLFGMDQLLGLGWLVAPRSDPAVVVCLFAKASWVVV